MEFHVPLICALISKPMIYKPPDQLLHPLHDLSDLRDFKKFPNTTKTLHDQISQTPPDQLPSIRETAIRENLPNFKLKK
jgi:hypothetical protein